MNISLDEWGTYFAPFSVKYKVDPFYVIFVEGQIKVSTRLFCRKEKKRKEAFCIPTF